MKTKFLSISILLYILSISIGIAQSSKTISFKVFGNCDSCKVRIEKAAQGVKGVSLAYWNLESKLINVTLDTTITNVTTISKAIAKVGHDTKYHYATEKAYNSIPDCCQFERRIDQNKIKFN